MVTLIRRHPLVAYYVLTFALSWGGFVLVVGPSSLVNTNWQAEGKFLAAVMVMLAGPSIAGLLLTGLVDGRAGYHDLFLRLRKWRVGIRWYALAILPAPIVSAGVLFTMSMTSPLLTADNKAAVVLGGLGAGATTILEEIGWTGFVVPRLRRRHGIPMTGLIVGVLWGLWHFLQQVFISGTYAGGIPLVTFLMLSVFAAVANLTAYRVLMVWVYDRTGSLLVTTLMHGMLTASSIFWFTPIATGALFLANVWLVAAVMWLLVGAVAVFDEQRYFTPDNRPLVFELNGTSFGVNICEDTWFSYTPECAKSAGAEVLLVLNGSPFHLGKQQQRFETLRANVARYRLPVAYANLVGGQDELVFDGGSFVLDGDGKLVANAPYFEESLLLVNFIDGVPQPSPVIAEPGEEALAYSALVLGVRDYLGKNSFPSAIIGLSGGVDSALTLAIAVDALGAERVRAVMMPSQFTLPMSLDDAQQMAQTMKVRYDVLPIKPAFDAFLSTLAREFRGLPWDTTEENLQARIRGTLLMALSNKYGSIVLTTGNKSETAVGYSTLYGDLAGGFAVIKDILKTLVYRLCRYRNSIAPVIPERILLRAPTAELKADQTDQDSLPPYDVLDEIIDLYMQQGRSIAEIVAADHDEAVVRKVVRMIRLSEYKRRQSPIGIRVTHRGFGRDWRYPVTNRFREESVTL